MAEKTYQNKAVSKLLAFTKIHLEYNEKATIVFKAPTGSGKTFMMTKYIERIIKENENSNLCFLWISIGDGNLHEHSYKSVKKNIDPIVQCDLLENEFFGFREYINPNEVVFLNWEKIRMVVNGEYANKLMKGNDHINFRQVLENTRNKGIVICLIIDECHVSANSKRALELRDKIINPYLTIEMSATPVISNDVTETVVVSPIDVIEEGMIKKEVIINKDIEIDESMKESFSEEIVLKSAYNKRLELKNQFEEINRKINPLVIIQLPNGENGDVKKNSVLSFLEGKGCTERNGKVAVWLSEEKMNTEEDMLCELNSPVEFLLFKQAIDTGWDCPRAQILVKFRETTNKAFETQTVGRILRMPEPEIGHYENDALNTAYVYTNINSIVIKKESYNANNIKSLRSRRDDNIYTFVKLNSYYKNRIDYGDITSQFETFLEQSFCNYFKINIVDTELSNAEYNRKQMENKGVDFDKNSLDRIIANMIIESKDVDKIKKLKADNYINLNYSPSDMDIIFNKIIKENLGSFAPNRSTPRVKSALYKVFRKYLHISPKNGGITLIQFLVVGNKEVFSIILKNAVSQYQEFKKSELSLKQSGRYNSEWEIVNEKFYNPETNIKIESGLSLHKPLYLPILKNDKPNELEVDFIKFLDRHSEHIKWFWKNGDEHMESNFGIQKEDGSTFQPDYIVCFADNKIGFFDTKPLKRDIADTAEKAKALYTYLGDERIKGNNYIGGIIIKNNNGEFLYFWGSDYHSYETSKDRWNSFESIFKNIQ